VAEPYPSARVKALRFFNEIDKKGGKALRWDLYKIAGNEANLNNWLQNFFLHHDFLREIKQEGRIYYEKTEAGQKWHQIILTDRFLTAYRQISGKKLRPFL